MLHYILQTVIFQLLFLMVYDVFLKKETFFNWNRFYLLASALLSVVLPFVKIDRFKEIIPQEYIITLPEVLIGELEKETIIKEQLVNNHLVTEFVFSWHYIIYMGCAIALILFTVKLVNVLTIAYKNPKTKLGKTLLIELVNSATAFSFFNYIFLGDAIKPEERQSILAHELEHVKQKHSLDLLFFELLRILFWFNPLIYVYQNRIANLHEFIADSKAIKSGNKHNYYHNLLSQVFDTKKVSFINPFFKKSLIKKRIIMLSKTKSKQINLLKYILLIPMVIGMLLYTSCSQKTDEDLTTVNNELDLEQYSYSLEKNEKMSEKKKEIHNRYETFLKENKEYVSWASRDETKETTTYSIHKISDKVPQGFTKMAVRFKDGTSYVTFMDFSTFKTRGSLAFNEEIKAINIGEPSKNPKIYKNGEVSFETVEQVPVFPGCEGSENPKKCMSTHINKIVATNFNTDLGKALGLNGLQKINAFFTINTSGDIVDLKTRAPHEELEREVRRVINMLPKLKPGEQDGKPINVKFFLPIKFNVKGDSKATEQIKNDSTDPVAFAVVEEVPIYPGCENLIGRDNLKECITNNVSKFVARNFDTKKMETLGFKGVHKINALFIIDKTGSVTSIKIRAKYPEMETETRRVINLLPKLKPGKQNGKPVDVNFYLPINFKIHE